MLTKYKEIDLTYNVYCPELFARKVWQELFNVYRGMGDTEKALSHMDSILCDHNILNKHFSDFLREQKSEKMFISWSGYNGWTEISFHDTVEDSEWCCQVSGDGIVVECSCQKLTFYKWSNDEETKEET